MNIRIDLTNLGGFPTTQFTLAQMQDSYRGNFAALANLVGSKVILYGVEDDGAGNISDGWISYNGEFIPFVGGPVNTKVVITETPVARTFEDTNTYDAYFTKSATCALLGDFDFVDLVPLLTLQNTWLPGDLKQKYVDNAYIAANFTAGVGINKEKGWAILSSVVAAAAGKVFVNRDPADVDFDTTGNNGGAKTHTLTGAEQGSIKFKGKIDDVGGGGTTVVATLTVNGVLVPKDGGANQASDGTEITVPLNSDANPHNNMQPYFVVLTLIKL